MLTTEEKRFFIDTALGIGRISKCPLQQGAVLVRGSRILSHGYNRRIVPNKDWEISAIYDALFGARDTNLLDTALFSTYFPPLDDTKLILATGVSTLYFLGKITSPETVSLLNSLQGSSISLEVIHLE
jgi:deoxycytidylate deaminase